MQTTNSKIAAISFAAIAVFGVGCNQTKVADEPNIQMVEIAKTPDTASEPRTVEFEGVSFTYDPTVFGNVKSEIVPRHELEDPSFKPDGVAPEYILFTFELGEEYREAELSVYPLKEFPYVYAVNKQSVKGMKDEIAALKTVIKDPSYRINEHIPHLPYVDAHQDFQAKVRTFPFQNGRGIIFVMHWDIEFNLMSNDKLVYRYEGITNDGEYYVTAQMPIKVPFLPDEAPDVFEGYRVYDEHGLMIRPFDEKRDNEYRKIIAKRVEALPSSEFLPLMKYMEDLISSLSIKKTKH